MESDVLSLLVKQMEDEKTAMKDTLVEGAVGTFDKYREMCGRIYGLAIAQRIVGDMRVRLKQEDE